MCTINLLYYGKSIIAKSAKYYWSQYYDRSFITWQLCYWYCQSGADRADTAAVVIESQQTAAVPQSAGNSEDVELQSAELKRAEMKLIRQIESIQEERSVLCTLLTLKNV